MAHRLAIVAKATSRAGRIRTCGCSSQSAMPYPLATALHIQTVFALNENFVLKLLSACKSLAYSFAVFVYQILNTTPSFPHVVNTLRSRYTYTLVIKQVCLVVLTSHDCSYLSLRFAVLSAASQLSRSYESERLDSNQRHTVYKTDALTY